MKNLFGWMLAALLALTVGVSCSDDDDLNEGAGIASPAWKAENQAVIEGERQKLATQLDIVTKCKNALAELS